MCWDTARDGSASITVIQSPISYTHFARQLFEFVCVGSRERREYRPGGTVKTRQKWLELHKNRAGALVYHSNTYYYLHIISR